jgi:hypothetical protein
MYIDLGHGVLCSTFARNHGCFRRGSTVAFHSAYVVSRSGFSRQTPLRHSSPTPVGSCTLVLTWYSSPGSGLDDCSNRSLGSLERSRPSSRWRISTSSAACCAAQTGKAEAVWGLWPGRRRIAEERSLGASHSMLALTDASFERHNTHSHTKPSSVTTIANARNSQRRCRDIVLPVTRPTIRSRLHPKEDHCLLEDTIGQRIYRGLRRTWYKCVRDARERLREPGNNRRSVRLLKYHNSARKAAALCGGIQGIRAAAGN